MSDDSGVGSGEANPSFYAVVGLEATWKSLIQGMRVMFARRST